MHQPLVAVSTDVRQFDNYTWHAAPRQYLEAAVSAAGVFPLLVPSFGERLDLDELLAQSRRRHGDGVEIERASIALRRRCQRGERAIRPRPRRHHPAADPQGARIRRPLAGDLPRYSGTERGAWGHARHRDPGTRGFARPPRAGQRQSGRAFRHPPESVDRSREAALQACSAPATSRSIPCIAKASTVLADGFRSRLSRRTERLKRYRSRMRARSPSAFSGIRNTGQIPTRTREKSFAPSATPRGRMRLPGPERGRLPNRQRRVIFSPSHAPFRELRSAAFPSKTTKRDCRRRDRPWRCAYGQRPSRHAAAASRLARP